MSQFIEVFGGKPLQGRVEVGGAKNAVLPLLLASLLTPETCTFSRVPNIQDVEYALRLLETLGADISFSGNQVSVTIERLNATEASYSLVKALRASFWVLGPLLARGGAARVALPGGDIIGARPVDMHLAGLQAMGADVKVSHGVVFATALKGLRPAQIDFRFPSVGATHQLLMTAALVPGTTVLKGVAREPEVVALAHMLSMMGAQIEGAGSSEIVIHGRESLNGANLSVIGDRLEAATYLLAGVATKGRVTACGIDPTFLSTPLDILESMGCEIELTEDSITVEARGDLKPVDIKTGPFPQFATDLQPLFAAVLSLASGESSIEETIFEGRFGYVSDLCRMGARITIQDQRAVITGVDNFSGALVEGLDIRAAGALLIAALAGEGYSQIHEIQHLRRGYERLEEKMSKLGAEIKVKVTDPEDFIFIGC